MPALHWSSPGSGAADHQLSCFGGGPFPNPFFWTGQVGLERFFGVPCLKQGTVEVILIQICSQDMRLVMILWPPRSNINIGLISRNLLDEGPAAKFT